MWLALAASAACGKAGPPLPPLVRVPAPPAELVAARRGARVDLRFTVPNSNSDGSRPANEDRVDVYAMTATEPITADEIIKRGTLVGRIDVKAPRDPDKAVEADESDADVEPPAGPGLDQGAVAHVTELLAGAAFTPAGPSRDPRKEKRGSTEPAARPLLGPAAPPSRVYVAVGFSTRGRKGLPSNPAPVPLVMPPPAPEPPSIAYDETAVTVTWKPVTLSGMVQQSDADGVLPSTPIGTPLPSVAYHVYDVSAADAHADVAADKLTATPAAQPAYTDARITWGQRRCYTVRALETINDLTLEGEASAVQCVTLADRFPPAAPKNVQAVPNEGSISLIWDPNPEKDLAGYLVFRGGEGGEAAQQVTPRPIEEARFNDPVAPGVRYSYVVKAVDKAGNISAASAPASAAAR